MKNGTEILKLGYFEFSAALVPGATLLIIISIIDPKLLLPQKFYNGISDFGLFFILSFVTGHLLQTVGKFVVDKLWWENVGGYPTKWPFHDENSTKRVKRIFGVEKLIDRKQIPVLIKKINIKLKLKVKSSKDKALNDLARLLHLYLEKDKMNDRKDLFLAHYELTRGLFAVFGFMAWYFVCELNFVNVLYMISFSLLSFSRMNTYAIHYASENYALLLLKK